MKKKAWVILCAMLLLLPVIAFAASLPVAGKPTKETVLPGTELKFTRRDFYGGQTLPVYYGPGVEYGRGSNGWAKALTDEPLYAAGKENGWALVMYGTSGGSVRVGYVDLDQFKYNTKILKLQELNFEYRTVTTSSDCILTDDPVLNNRDLAFLYAGTEVTYLASYYKYRQWAYIETWVEGHPIRGFIPADCVNLN